LPEPEGPTTATGLAGGDGQLGAFQDVHRPGGGGQGQGHAFEDQRRRVGHVVSVIGGGHSGAATPAYIGRDMTNTSDLSRRGLLAGGAALGVAACADGASTKGEAEVVKVAAPGAGSVGAKPASPERGGEAQRTTAAAGGERPIVPCSATPSPPATG
jgi:hypothetical protein